MALSARTAALIALLLLDIDFFKHINDSMGHLAGDKLLKEAAGRIQSVLRSSDTVARLGGDEFAILLDGIQAPEEAMTTTIRILETMREPMLIGGRQLSISASCGIAHYTGVETRPEELLGRADIAMYRVKGEGKSGYRVYENAMGLAARERLGIKTDLRLALERGQFRVVYQPIVDLLSFSLRGCEALIRWAHPERGLVPPADFIPHPRRAEQAGEDAGVWCQFCGDVAHVLESNRSLRRRDGEARRYVGRLEVNDGGRLCNHVRRSHDTAVQVAQESIACQGVRKLSRVPLIFVWAQPSISTPAIAQQETRAVIR